MVIQATSKVAGLKVSASPLTTESDISVIVVLSWLDLRLGTVLKMVSGKDKLPIVNVS